MIPWGLNERQRKRKRRGGIWRNRKKEQEGKSRERKVTVEKYFEHSIFLIFQSNKLPRHFYSPLHPYVIL